MCVLQVARGTFTKALQESRAVIMVPGGQAELVHTWRFFRRKEFVIYTRHKGVHTSLNARHTILVSSVKQLPAGYDI